MFTETETETLAEKLTNRDITDYTDSRNHLNRKTELTVTHGGGSVMLWAVWLLQDMDCHNWLNNEFYLPVNLHNLQPEVEGYASAQWFKTNKKIHK